MATPTDDNPNLLGAQHLVDFASKLEDLLAGGSEGLVITRLQRIK